MRAAVHPVALDRDGAVELHEAFGDQVGRPGAREPEHPRHRGVHPLSRQAVGHGDDPCSDEPVTIGRPRRRGARDADAPPGLDDDQHHGDVDQHVGDVEHRPVRQRRGSPRRARAAHPGSRKIRSVRLPQTPASSSPSATAQVRSPRRRPKRITTPAATSAITDSTSVYDVPVLNAAPGLRTRSSRSTTVDDVDRVALGQVAHREDLGEQVDGVRRHRDGDEHPRGGSATSRVGTARDVGPGPRTSHRIGGSQRRSSRCLHVRHSVARGNAMARPLPIGLPHDSQMP